MSELYSVASFTKNFSWNRSYKRLHRAIRSGFSGGLLPTKRAAWRKLSAIGDQDLELIPMNFFLYSMPTIRDDFILIDGLVELACRHPYDIQFAKFALFAFHLAN